MKCEHCGRESAESYLTGEGIACRDCADASAEKYSALLETMAHEPLDCAPVEMDVAAFELWVLKLAVQTLKSLSSAQRASVAKRNPVMLLPGDLAMHFKALIFVCLAANEFEARMTGPRKGQFWFKKPVKFTSVKRAAFEAGLISEVKKMDPRR